MADEKKRDDFKVDIGDEQPRETFDAHPLLGQRSPTMTGGAMIRPENQGMLSIIAYCGSSIMMTVANKYVLSSDYNLNFFLLAVQVCPPFGSQS
jgi:GDP-mannose transporter